MRSARPEPPLTRQNRRALGIIPRCSYGSILSLLSNIVLSVLDEFGGTSRYRYRGAAIPDTLAGHRIATRQAHLGFTESPLR